MVYLGRKIVVVALLAASTGAFAQLVTLTNNGSIAKINAGTGADGNQGLNNWTIGGGPNNVVQEAFLYRVGTGAVDIVNNISAPSINQPTGDLATVGYTSAASLFDLNLRYLLTGGAPNSADLSEVATVINRGNTNLVFSLYEYDFFSPGGSRGGVGNLLNSSTIRHSNNFGSVTVGATPIPTHWMIDTPGNVAGTILGSGTLTDSTNGFSNTDGLAFAFQWNFVVAPGQSWQMSKDKLLSVPEPASLLALGGLALLVVRRRRAR